MSTTICLPPFFSRPSEAHACLFPAIMSKGSSSSHARWQRTARWKQGWKDALEEWDESSATTLPGQNPEQASHERVTNALHRMQDHVQQTMVLPSKPHQVRKGMLPMRPWRLACDPKRQDAAEAKTIYNDAIKNNLEKKRSTREIRKDGDHGRGILDDHGSRLLSITSRTPEGDTADPQ